MCAHTHIHTVVYRSTCVTPGNCREKAKWTTFLTVLHKSYYNKEIDEFRDSESGSECDQIHCAVQLLAKQDSQIHVKKKQELLLLSADSARFCHGEKQKVTHYSAS